MAHSAPDGTLRSPRIALEAAAFLSTRRAIRDLIRSAQPADGRTERLTSPRAYPPQLLGSPVSLE
jgi:hypothetical protein